MNSEEMIAVGDADIASTAEKLVAFSNSLTPAEQAVLGHVVTLAARAGQASSEVSGYFTLIELTNVQDVQQMQAALLGAFAMGDGSVRFLLPAVQRTHGAGGGGGAG
jgi:hypothetical protein